MNEGEWAKAMIFAHSQIHKDLIEGCPTCDLILRAQRILEDVLDCDLPYTCRADHDLLLGTPTDEAYEEILENLEEMQQ